MDSYSIDCGLLVGLLAIAIVIYFALKSIPSTLSKIKEHTEGIPSALSALSRIEEHTKPIKK